MFVVFYHLDSSAHNTLAKLFGKLLPMYYYLKVCHILIFVH